MLGTTVKSVLYRATLTPWIFTALSSDIKFILLGSSNIFLAMVTNEEKLMS